MARHAAANRTRHIDAVCPELSKVTGVVMPIFDVRLRSVEKNISILSSKTRPKKICCIGLDGKKYNLLLKGHENLNVDDAMSLMFRLSNLCGSNKDFVRCFRVLPFGAHSGLIEWIDATTPAFDLFRNWQKRRADQRDLVKSSVINTTVARLIEKRPTECWQAEIDDEMKILKIDRSMPRRMWPSSLLEAVYKRLKENAPKELLSNELLCSRATAGEWMVKVRSLTFSIASSSIVGYCVGLGDRHLDNILIDFDRGELSHIDFNIVLERGRQLRVPESVPFRLTQNFENVIRGHQSFEMFESHAQYVLSQIQQNGPTMLKTVLRTFLFDPICELDEGRLVGQQQKVSEFEINVGLLHDQVFGFDKPVHDNIAAVLASLKPVDQILDSHSLLATSLMSQYKRADVLIEKLQKAQYEVQALKSAREMGPIYLKLQHLHERCKSAASGIRATLSNLATDVEAMNGRISEISAKPTDSDIVLRGCKLLAVVCKHLQEYDQLIAPLRATFQQRDYFVAMQHILDAVMGANENYEMALDAIAGRVYLPPGLCEAFLVWIEACRNRYVSALQHSVLTSNISALSAISLVDTGASETQKRVLMVRALMTLGAPLVPIISNLENSESIDFGAVMQYVTVDMTSFRSVMSHRQTAAPGALCSLLCCEGLFYGLAQMEAVQFADLAKCTTSVLLFIDGLGDKFACAIQKLASAVFGCEGFPDVEKCLDQFLFEPFNSCIVNFQVSSELLYHHVLVLNSRHCIICIIAWSSQTLRLWMSLALKALKTSKHQLLHC